ncbi:MAG TPA: Gfo/Idh/MocA family oxidoreductase [Anaerolineae bacterium]|nr:Gfo/Idh/MocA family oxidoreductase [Anaerolineae bacterium]
MSTKTRLAMIGVGGMARHHIRQILRQNDTTEITVICEPSLEQYETAASMFEADGLRPPPNEPDLDRLLATYPVDAAFIITPHVFHHNQAVVCMGAGVDVLLEKPMVMNASEAEHLIDVQQQTGRLLVVAFQGSLSPQVRAASAMLRAGKLGRLLSISATVWQGWGPNTAGTWRQIPQMAGGGFLFDTGAHMLNTVVDLAGEGFAEVAAWLDNNGRDVETMGVVMGRLRSGPWVTMHGCGETINTWGSEIQVFCTEGILRTGIWGERLQMQRKAGPPRFNKVRLPESMGVWQQFLAVRNGEIENPSPPEVGLRMARLYDAITESAAQGGQPVRLL